MIVPFSQASGTMAFGDIPSETNQLMALAQIKRARDLQAQSAPEENGSHKGYRKDAEGKVG